VIVIEVVEVVVEMVTELQAVAVLPLVAVIEHPTNRTHHRSLNVAQRCT